ncbi:hypothetical protein E2C01_094620 [Portunus trituberculatus]|uniref:Uncharacterized protein n=1 Tax=Portunus trituberculatus TaxID=210409 RepID=A0A5B7JQY4_PORTR|nr:hypothetical protein [Portunus trituberculatus]
MENGRKRKRRLTRQHALVGQNNDKSENLSGEAEGNETRENTYKQTNRRTLLPFKSPAREGLKGAGAGEGVQELACSVPPRLKSLSAASVYPGAKISV